MKTNFLTKAIAIIAFLFSLASCMEKIGDERFESQTFVRGDYLLTPKVDIKIETIKEIIHDTTFLKVVVMDSIFIHDTLPPIYIYDTVEVEVPVPYPVHDTVIVVKSDTVWQTIIEERIDTLYVDNSFSGVRRGKCYVAGKGKAAVQQYTFDKGDIVNQEVLYGSVEVSLSSGKTEVKNEAVLNSTAPNMTDNSFSFDVTDGVGGANVTNTWGYEYNAVAQFDGFTETIDAELSIETADFYQRSDLEWCHMVTASLDGIPQANETWEFWKEEEVIVPDPTYALTTEHSGAKLEGNSIVDTHIANLLKDGEKVESHEYDALWSINYSKKLTLPRETAEAIANTTVSLNNGSCELGSYEFFANLNLSKVESVSMQENGTTYCHPAFAAENAVATLNCCNLHATSVVMGTINDDVLPAEIVVVGHEEIRVPFTINVEKEIKYTVEWDDVKFSPDMRQVTRRGYRVKNNVRTGVYKDVTLDMEYTFIPGAPLEFNSNDTPSIKDANAVLVGNEAFIPHILGSTEFNANFTYGGTSRVTFSYSDEYVSDESTVDLNITYSVKATGAIEQNGTSYSTPAAFYANGVEVEKEKFVFSVKPVEPTYPGYRVYNAGQWAITRIYNQNASQSLVVLVGTLEHIQTGDIYAIHQVLEGSAGNLPKDEPQEVSTPRFTYPYSMFYNVATSAWEYGCIVGANKGTTNLKWMYYNWNWTDNQIVSENTSTDLLNDVVLYQLGSEDNIASEAGTISLSYNGQTITVVSDK